MDDEMKKLQEDQTWELVELQPEWNLLDVSGHTPNIRWRRLKVYVDDIIITRNDNTRSKPS